MLDTRECNIDMVLLNGIEEGPSVGFLVYVKVFLLLGVPQYLVQLGEIHKKH